MKAYKLFRLKKNGAITPLFINKTRELPMGEWLIAEDHPTKGFTHRPGWHCCKEMKAPHLSKEGRIWGLVEIDGWEVHERPESQGGEWYTAERMKIIHLFEDNNEFVEFRAHTWGSSSNFIVFSNEDKARGYAKKNGICGFSIYPLGTMIEFDPE